MTWCPRSGALGRRSSYLVRQPYYAVGMASIATASPVVAGAGVGASDVLDVRPLEVIH